MDLTRTRKDLTELKAMIAGTFNMAYDECKNLGVKKECTNNNNRQGDERILNAAPNTKDYVKEE